MFQSFCMVTLFKGCVASDLLYVLCFLSHRFIFSFVKCNLLSLYIMQNVYVIRQKKK